MSNTPNMPTMPIISTLTLFGKATNRLGLGASISTATGYVSANRAYYMPFHFDVQTTIKKVFTYNGGTASNNFDIGIYTIDGTKITSTGSTAMSGTSTIQVVDITDITLPPGKYYMAFAMNGTTGQIGLWTSLTSVITGAMLGVYIQASAFPLPATATFSNMASTAMPIFGFSTVTTV